jgi:hypothetical protein
MLAKIAGNLCLQLETGYQFQETLDLRVDCGKVRDRGRFVDARSFGREYEAANGRAPLSHESESVLR